MKISIKQIRCTTKYIKHKGVSGLQNFLPFNQARQICDLTSLLNVLNLCQNANLATCKLDRKVFQIPYVSYTHPLWAIIKANNQKN